MMRSIFIVLFALTGVLATNKRRKLSDGTVEIITDPETIGEHGHEITTVIADYLPNDPQVLARFSISSVHCRELVRSRLLISKAEHQVAKLLDPILSAEDFFLEFESLIAQCRQSEVVMEALKRELTEHNVIYLARLLSSCNHFCPKSVESAVRFLITECHCKSLAGFMMGGFIDLFSVMDVDCALTKNYLLPNCDVAVLDRIPDSVWVIINRIGGSCKNIMELGDALPDRYRLLPDIKVLSEELIENHPDLIRGNAQLMSDLLQIGVSFDLDVLCIPDLTLSQFRTMAPYLGNISLDLYEYFPSLITQGFADYFIEIFQHRKLVREISTTFFPKELYLFCFVAIRFGRPDILNCFTAIPQIKAFFKTFAESPFFETVNMLDTVKAGANDRWDQLLSVRHLKGFDLAVKQALMLA